MALATAAAAAVSANAGELREVPLDTPGLLKVVRPLGGGGGGASTTNHYLPTEVVHLINFVDDPPIEPGGFVTEVGEFDARNIPLLSSGFGKPVLVERVGARFNINDTGENAPFHDPRDNEYYRVTVWDGKENAQLKQLPWALVSGTAEYSYPQDSTACRSVVFSSATKLMVGRPELGQTLNWIERPEFHSWQVSANVEQLGMVVESGNVVAGISPIVGAYVASGTYTEITTVSGAALVGTEVMLRLDRLDSSPVNMPTVEASTSRPDRNYTLVC